MKRILLALLSISALILSACSDNKENSPNITPEPAPLKAAVTLIDKDTEEFLKQFKEDPKKVVNERPKKYSADGLKRRFQVNSWLANKNSSNQGQKISDRFQYEQAVRRGDECLVKMYESKFKAQATQRKAKKEGNQAAWEQAQKKIDKLSADCKLAWKNNDRPQDLVDSGDNLVLNLKAMERYRFDGKFGAELGKQNQPWSSDYWAIRNGILAKRYGESSYPKTDAGWKAVSNFYLRNGADPKVFTNSLSPAEKYDMLMGDQNWTLTKAHIAEGQKYFESNGEVESWMGICHGWATAAYMEARPVKSVEAMAPNGEVIEFYPDDIKGLTVLLWADGQTVSKKTRRGATRFIGGRCNKKEADLEKDENDLILDKDCFDTNPGTWHVAAVNQIAISKRSFVMDATFDYEVWNQPVYSYSYRYFNPETLNYADSYEAARADADFSGDRFEGRRARNARSIVGIVMDVNYVVETEPRARRTDSHENDALTKVRYIYDLELDASGNIVGGMWYQNLHPDFLWTAEPNSTALSNIDVSRSLQGLTYTPSTFQAPQREFLDAHNRQAWAWINEPSIGSKPKVHVLNAVVSGLIKASAE